MSLYLIGSVSRVTSNIITQLARNKQYASVTIADLLPSYNNMNRYYRLQQDLEKLQLDTSIEVKLEKLFDINQIHSHTKYDDVLYVTHDYYSHVTSKTKLMSIVAEICHKRPRLFFATPVEYDHFGYANPTTTYLEAHNKVIEVAPQSTIIRSDVQDKTETFAYINSKKDFLDGQLFNFFANKPFAPKTVCSYKYADIVANALKDKAEGQRVNVEG